MLCLPLRFALVWMIGLSVTTAARSAQEEKPDVEQETVVYDEAKRGDLGPIDADSKTTVRLDKAGVYVVQGTGTDAVDDVDAFVFEVTGKKPFDFCLEADAAEFKWLRAVAADGTVSDVAFGSTNLTYRAPRNISKRQLSPGTYRVEMLFGPDGASGRWVAKISPRDGQTETKLLCRESAALATAEKVKQVDWPGAISIFHGHNWGTDEKYVIAIKEAGFRATGSTEAQIEHCRKYALRAFVFIWPHEAGTIPAKHKDDKTVLCYYLSDRIQPAKWGLWAALEDTAYQGDPYHPAIFTMRGLWGGIDQFCPHVRARAMEYYHYHWDGNRHPQRHFALLEQYLQASTANGHVPVCRIVETRPEDMRKTRQTVYTCLAYGVRGFRMGGRGLFDTDKRDERGVPTRTSFGEETRKINLAINAYSPVFKETVCQAVYHTPPLPAGCKAAPKEAWVQPAGQDVLVGVFRPRAAEQDQQESTNAGKEEPDYLLVANRDAFHARTATLMIRGGGAQVQRMDKTTAKWVDYAGESKDDSTRLRVELEEGSGELFKVTGHRR